MEERIVAEIDSELKRRAQIFAIENGTTLKHVISFSLKSFLDRQDGIEEPADDREIEIH